MHPNLCNDLKDAADAAEKLGTTGTTLFYCENYTSPLHKDDDSVRGLCAQYRLNAQKEYREYAFIYAEYGFYVVSQANSLW